MGRTVSTRGILSVAATLALVPAAGLPVAAPALASSAHDRASSREVLFVGAGPGCPQADYGSVQAAVDAASPGALVRVCPGQYAGLVRIDKPLTLLGDPDAVAALGCGDPTTRQPDDSAPTAYPVLDRPTGTPGNLVTVASGGVVVAGLVLEGADTPVPEAPGVVDAAIDLRPGSAGTRVHHNLLQHNDLGIDLGSDGSATTRVDHNCLRDNRWGLASQRHDFVGGRVDHNESSSHAVFGFGVGDLASTRDSVFDHNASHGDDIAFFVRDSSDVAIRHNDVTATRIGLLSQGGNTGLSITDNEIVGDAGTTGTHAGVIFQAVGRPASHGVLVAGNAISSFGGTAHTVGLGIAITSPNGRDPSVDGLEVARNVLVRNAVGVSVLLTNPGVEVRDNIASSNRQYGIRARKGAPGAPVVGATFTNNTMLGNGSPPFDGAAGSDADAFDATLDGDQSPRSLWSANVCEHDIPVGRICGVG